MSNQVTAFACARDADSASRLLAHSLDAQWSFVGCVVNGQAQVSQYRPAMALNPTRPSVSRTAGCGMTAAQTIGSPTTPDCVLVSTTQANDVSVYLLAIAFAGYMVRLLRRGTL